jgi:alpha-L-rhamnosidase
VCWLLPTCVTLARVCADDQIVAVHYPGVRAYLESWLNNHMKGNLSAFCDWGDWCPYEGGCQSCSEDYGSYFLIRALDMTATMATLLGNTADAAKYTAQAAASRAAYRVAFNNNNTYAEGRPINQLFALSLGIPTAQERPAVYAVLRQAIENGSYPMHNAGGIITTKLLYPVLDEFGDTDVGIATVLQT